MCWFSSLLLDATIPHRSHSMAILRFYHWLARLHTQTRPSGWSPLKLISSVNNRWDHCLAFHLECCLSHAKHALRWFAVILITTWDPLEKHRYHVTCSSWFCHLMSPQWSIWTHSGSHEQVERGYDGAVKSDNGRIQYLCFSYDHITIAYHSIPCLGTVVRHSGSDPQRDAFSHIRDIVQPRADWTSVRCTLTHLTFLTSNKENQICEHYWQAIKKTKFANITDKQ